MSEIKCYVQQITALTDTVKQVILKPETKVDFAAGQYVMVVLNQDDKRPFSIANAPQKDGLLELHIGAAENNPYAMQAIEHLQANPQSCIDGPHGKAHLQTHEPKPTLLVAGGTGFSYTYSILQQRLQLTDSDPVFLYWGTRTKQDMYAFDALTALAEQHAHFTFIPVIENPEQDWSGKTGWVHKAVLEDFVCLEPYHIYIAGRFEMAGVAREDFMEKGAHKHCIFGDAYEFI